MRDPICDARNARPVASAPRTPSINPFPVAITAGRMVVSTTLGWDAPSAKRMPTSRRVEEAAYAAVPNTPATWSIERMASDGAGSPRRARVMDSSEAIVVGATRLNRRKTVSPWAADWSNGRYRTMRESFAGSRSQSAPCQVSTISLVIPR